MEWILLFIITTSIIMLTIYGHIYLHIYYTFDDGQDDLKIKIYLFDLVKIYQMNRHGILQTTAKKIIDQIISSPATGAKIPSIKKPDLSKLPWVCHNISLNGRLGIGNAAYTAIAIGSLHSIFPLLSRYLNTKIRCLSVPIIAIEPDFQQSVHQLNFKCILSVKIGHIFYILKTQLSQ